MEIPEQWVLFSYLYFWLWTDSTHCSSIPIVDFEQGNAVWAVFRNQSIDLQCKLIDWFLYDGEHWSLMNSMWRISVFIFLPVNSVTDVCNTKTINNIWIPRRILHITYVTKVPVLQLAYAAVYAQSLWSDRLLSSHDVPEILVKCCC